MANSRSSLNTRSPFKALRAAAIDGRLGNVRYRQDQLQKLHTKLSSLACDFIDFLVKQNGSQRGDAEQEVSMALTCLRVHYDSLNFEESIKDEYRVARGQNFAHNRIPIGIIHIKPGSFTPFFSIVAPLCAALAAGNCVVIELERNSTSIATLLHSALSGLDQDVFQVIDNANGEIQQHLPPCLTIEETTSHSISGELLALPSSQRTVAVVDRTANLISAAEHIVRARFSLCGQSPYAPDLVLVNEFVTKPFLDAAVQHAIKYTSEEQIPPITKERKDLARSQQLAILMEKMSVSEKSDIIISGQRATVVCLQREYLSGPEKITVPMLLVASISSLDDAIDFSNNLNQRESYLASYVFGESASVKYLSQFIRANASFVNHIPCELLFGPAGPSSHPVAPLLRFTTDMFSIPKPQFVVPGSARALSRNGGNKKEQKTDPNSKNQCGKALSLQQALAPLKPTGQPLGGGIGFFEQGILTGVVLLVLPAFIGGLVASIFATKYIYRKWFG